MIILSLTDEKGFMTFVPLAQIENIAWDDNKQMSEIETKETSVTVKETMQEIESMLLQAKGVQILSRHEHHVPGVPEPRADQAPERRILP